MGISGISEISEIRAMANDVNSVHTWAETYINSVREVDRP